MHQYKCQSKLYVHDLQNLHFLITGYKTDQKYLCTPQVSSVKTTLRKLVSECQMNTARFLVTGLQGLMVYLECPFVTSGGYYSTFTNISKSTYEYIFEEKHIEMSIFSLFFLQKIRAETLCKCHLWSCDILLSSGQSEEVLHSGVYIYIYTYA